MLCTTAINTSSTIRTQTGAAERGARTQEMMGFWEDGSGISWTR